MKTITRPLRTNHESRSDEYLGFKIWNHANAYYAMPADGRWGNLLRAESIASLRKKIWCWWFQVQ